MFNYKFLQILYLYFRTQTSVHYYFMFTLNNTEDLIIGYR